MKKIAIFGLGPETEKNIEDVSNNYNVVGLLDSFLETGEMYGYPIISLECAIRQGIEKIIVIARPGSCKAIARNIGAKCLLAKISLQDLRGNDLLQKKDVKYNFDGIKGYTKSDLIRAVESAEILSVDLFDTLIMRKTLYFEDMLEILAIKVSESGLLIDDFGKRRLKAENELSREKAPYLSEIYAHMLSESNPFTLEQISEIEYEYDKSILVPRVDMVEIVNEFVKRGKIICITSDTYYKEEQIREILGLCGISDEVEVFTSCDNHTSKSQKLFGVLKEKYFGKRIVHIGDDIKVDVESANRYGIETFLIQSGRELFEILGCMGLSEIVNSISDRLKVGMLVAKMFNSPFVFEEGNFGLKTLKEIGYILFAPMILDFTKWIGEISHSKCDSTLLFSARDGYIIQKIYDIIYPKEKNYYFLTSRVAALRACVECKADIEHIESTRFSGNDSQKLKIRYGLSENECADCIDDNEEGFYKYVPAIIRKAISQKKNYLRYINDNICFGNKEVLFVDLSARGTIQMFCERLLGRKLMGLYFLQLEPEFAKRYSLEIKPFYKADGFSNNSIFEDFYIMEPVISSPDSSLDGFDENGNPVFALEERSMKEISVMEQIQEGILEYVSEYLAICPKVEITVNKQIDEEIFKLIHTVEILTEDFFLLRNIDSFVNRITDLKVEV